ncbi:anthranilate phosphoribosyltransferase family protein [Acaryochloris sp. 'Moss Beach']|uniref:anthranilate phosphoribosyltransferase family protein n=1 Tax=Acaryochloris sp. 'Moss Beach' TaxID=2740837 RepID=UPI001F2A89A5|nr:anthranilate phosphoribosyltransferase family protein [Acaryochloris sp. 'Moss Beach']UJB68437.1 anthranilate phosphoribosyltransferase family protein [Acaryochloris sp. 'Moss Beach']
MSQIFRELLKKVGSGRHTSKDLSRVEAQTALEMMLRQEATPAQIGAFLIAHRIKRPTGIELAGFLDAYEHLGPELSAVSAPSPVIVFSVPYDGRSRTAPVLPITALILAASGCPVLLHGGDRMPTKYGVPLVDLWQGLGVDWSHRSLAQIHQVLSECGLGFVYLPEQFPLAQGLVEFRDQVGKRPPLATTELLWQPYLGKHHLIAGFVHPPTENMMREALALRGTDHFTTVKGLEGSCDLPRDRKAILGLNQPASEPTWQRLILSAREYDLGGPEIPYTSTEELLEQLHAVLNGQACELMSAVLWNAGFYLWHVGISSTLNEGLQAAENLLVNGTAKQTLEQVQTFLADL